LRLLAHANYLRANPPANPVATAVQVFLFVYLLFALRRVVDGLKDLRSVSDVAVWLTLLTFLLSLAWLFIHLLLG